MSLERETEESGSSYTPRAPRPFSEFVNSVTPPINDTGTQVSTKMVTGISLTSPPEIAGNTKVEQVFEQLASHSELIVALQEKMSERDKAHQQEVQAHSDQLRQEKEAHQQEIAQFQATIEWLQQKLTQQQPHLNELESTVNAGAIERAQLQTVIAEQQRVLNQQQIMLNQQQSQLNDLETIVNDMIPQVDMHENAVQVHENQTVNNSARHPNRTTQQTSNVPTDRLSPLEKLQNLNTILNSEPSSSELPSPVEMDMSQPSYFNLLGMNPIGD